MNALEINLFGIQKKIILKFRAKVRSNKSQLSSKIKQNETRNISWFFRPSNFRAS